VLIIFAMEHYMLPCLFKKYFGIDCIGCGFQRALNLILHGEFTQAFQMFPAIYTSLLFFLFGAIYFIFPTSNNSKIVVFFAISNAIIMIASYVYKMKFLF